MTHPFSPAFSCCWSFVNRELRDADLYTKPLTPLLAFCILSLAKAFPPASREAVK
jgi:hypothetical protein